MKQRASLSSIFGPPPVENLDSPRSYEQLDQNSSSNNSSQSNRTSITTPVKQKKSSLMDMFNPPNASQQEESFLSPRNATKHTRSPSFGKNMTSASPFHSRRSSGSSSGFHFDFPEEPQKFEESFHKMVEDKEKEHVIFHQQQFELHKRQSVKVKKDNLLTELLKKFHSSSDTDKTESVSSPLANSSPTAVPEEQEVEELLVLEDILEEHFPTKEQVQESMTHSLEGLIDIKNKRFSLKRNQFTSKKEYLSYLLSRTIDQSLPDVAPGSEVNKEKQESVTTPQPQQQPIYTHCYVDFSCLENEINDFFDFSEVEELRTQGQAHLSSILQSLFSISHSKNVWVLLEEEKKVECMDYLVDRLECTEKIEKKMHYLYALLYIGLGLFGIENQKESQLKLIRIYNSLLFSKTDCFFVVLQQIMKQQSLSQPHSQYLYHLYNLLFLLLLCNAKSAQEDLACTLHEHSSVLFSQWIDMLYQLYQQTSPTTAVHVKKVLLLFFYCLALCLHAIHDTSISEVKTLQPNIKLKMNPYAHEEALLFANQQYKQEYASTFDLFVTKEEEEKAHQKQHSSSLQFNTLEWKQQLQQLLSHQKPLSNRKYSSTKQEKPIDTTNPLEQFYCKVLYPKLPQLILVLLQSILESMNAALSPNNASTQQSLLFTVLKREWIAQEWTVFGCCIVKAASDILFLLLKQCRKIHPMHGFYCNKLLCDANAVVLLLRFFNMGTLDSFVKQQETNHPHTILHKEQHSSIPYCMRNIHIVITQMRLLQKLSKHNPSTISILVKQKAYSILRKAVECIPSHVDHKMLHLYYLKIIKNMTSYLDNKWRKNNGKLITQISMYVRPYLLDDWLSDRKLEPNKLREMEDEKQDRLDQFYKQVYAQQPTQHEQKIEIAIPSQKELQFFIEEFFKSY